MIPPTLEELEAAVAAGTAEHDPDDAAMSNAFADAWVARQTFANRVDSLSAALNVFNGDVLGILAIGYEIGYRVAEARTK